MDRSRGQGPPRTGGGKDEWRQWARRVRSSLDPERVGREIIESLLAWDSFRSAERVLVYLAFDGEPELDELLSQSGKAFYTTRTLRHPEPMLSLHRLDPDELERHEFGFLQPALGSALVEPASVDLALVPGLAFDLRGNRLGYGMGFYDRLLPGLRPAVPRVGVCPSALLVDALPAESHDVVMTHLVTEAGLFPVGDV